MEDIKNTVPEMTETDNEVLSIYLREINRIPLISHEEEYELALKAKNGDKAAREKLSRPFILRFSIRYWNKSITAALMIAVSIGMSSPYTASLPTYDPRNAEQSKLKHRSRFQLL